MADTLTIILANLPEEGKSYTGELDAHVLSTSELDVVKPFGGNLAAENFEKLIDIWLDG